MLGRLHYLHTLRGVAAVQDGTFAPLVYGGVLQMLPILSATASGENVLITHGMGSLRVIPSVVVRTVAAAMMMMMPWG
eukprot:COSAG01_NODE_20753_length_937_cov_0.862768_2_plen_78_part_00